MLNIIFTYVFDASPAKPHNDRGGLADVDTFRYNDGNDCPKLRNKVKPTSELVHLSLEFDLSLGFSTARRHFFGLKRPDHHESGPHCRGTNQAIRHSREL